jgi:AraC-like DNA-binding protein
MSEQIPSRAIPPYTFGIAQTFNDLDTGWRPFPGHYLLYAANGAFQLEVEGARWLLPPQRAALIAADVPIRLSTRGTVTCNSVLFVREALLAPEDPCRVFAITALAREMLLHTMRWGMERDPSDLQAARFFAALADLCSELAAHPDQFWLPRPRSPELARAVAYALDNLGTSLSLAQAAHTAGVSERTLLRRFAEETRMNWREFLARARMIRAMELLEEHVPQVIEVAYATGFESVSAFSTAFRRFTGETPRQYRHRVAALVT